MEVYAGLITAQVLSDFFDQVTIQERDEIEDGLLSTHRYRRAIKFTVS